MEVNNGTFYAGDVFNRSGLSYCCSADNLSTATACKGTAVISPDLSLGNTCTGIATNSYAVDTFALEADVVSLTSIIDNLKERVTALETPQHKSRSDLRSALRTLNYRREV